MVNLDFKQTPQEIIDYLQNKSLTLTYNYDELLKQAHHKAFSVAKVTRMDLLNDIHNSLVDALKNSKNFQAWKKDIIPTLQKKGWWGTQDITNPKTGEIKQVVIGSRRLKTIYDTNMRVAYQKYRYEQMMSLPLSVYFMYRSALLENTRESHRQKHGLVLHKDHPFWQKNYPPNDYNCKCTVTAHSKKDLANKRITPIDDKFDNQIDSIASEYWDHNVGLFKGVAQLLKLDLSNVSNLRSISKNKEYTNLSDTALLQAFYSKLGVQKGDLFIDKVNDPMIIDDNLFLDKRTKKLKISKEERHLLLDEFIQTITNPDEIYLETDDYGTKKNMFRYFNFNGKKEAILVVFRYFKDKTQGATIFHVTRELEKRRQMKLIYKKE